VRLTMRWTESVTKSLPTFSMLHPYWNELPSDEDPPIDPPESPDRPCSSITGIVVMRSSNTPGMITSTATCSVANSAISAKGRKCHAEVTGKSSTLFTPSRLQQGSSPSRSSLLILATQSAFPWARAIRFRTSRMVTFDSESVNFGISKTWLEPWP
jgi:hypothetical protein